MALQGVFQFTGLNGVLDASFTLSHGICPSVARVTVHGSAAIPAAVGTMSFEYGNQQWTFANCLVDSASLSAGASNRSVAISIMDRRWRWQYGSITGRYNNQRRTGGVTALDRYLKRPQELAKMLLEAMGETRFDLSQLPDDTYPEVAWDNDIPALMLDQLCTSLGCRIVLTSEDRVRICRAGVGALLPPNALLEQGTTIDPPNRPDKLAVSTAPTIYQWMFLLEAVGLDLDGTVKPINKLSYVPDPVFGRTTTEQPWGDEDPEVFDGVALKFDDGSGTGDEQKARRAVELATQTVFRWFRVVTHCDGTLKFPGYEGEIQTIKQLFPLLDGLADKQRGDATDGPERKPEYVQGIFELNETSVRRYAIPAFVNSRNHETYQGDFSIDRERGIVMFSAPVFQRDVDGKIDEPELYLTAAVNVTEWKTNQRRREREERSLPGPKRGAGTREIVRSDIVPTVIARYKPFANTSFDDRMEVPGPIEKLERSEWQPEARYYLDAASREYQTEGAGDATYAGWLKINPDGAIQQVTWGVGQDGTFTRASRNDETSIIVPPYAERQRAGWVRILLRMMTGGLAFREKDPRDG